MSFWGFNSVSTDPRSFAYARIADDGSFEPCRMDGPDRSGSIRPLLATCAGLRPSLFQCADGARPTFRPLSAMFRSYLSCGETSISF